MAGDYIGEDDFADSVVESTLDTLAGQQDDKQVQEDAGSFTIQPQAFQVSPAIQTQVTRTSREYLAKIYSEMGQERRHMLYGPVKFKVKFDGIPQPQFEQGPQALAGIDPVANVADSYTPFLVIPYVYRWTFTNGEVDGFLIGLYAQTPPPLGSNTHTIFWKVSGKASRYNTAGEPESWSDPYDYNEPDYIVDDTGIDTDEVVG